MCTILSLNELIFYPNSFLYYNAHEPVYQLLADAFYKIGVLSPMEQNPETIIIFTFFSILNLIYSLLFYPFQILW